MSTFGGMERWNGIVEWTTGMVECFIGHTLSSSMCCTVNSELYALQYSGSRSRILERGLNTSDARKAGNAHLYAHVTIVYVVLHGILR